MEISIATARRVVVASRRQRSWKLSATEKCPSRRLGYIVRHAPQIRDRLGTPHRIQEKEFHHEEHKDHEGGIGNIIIARLCFFSSLRVLRFFVVLFS
jgi:hypothetical protein